MNSCPLHERDVAYFVHLHLDTVTADEDCDHPDCNGVWAYRVHGKPRPMLVLGLFPKPCRGRVWVKAVPLTTKGEDGKGRQRDDVMLIGKLVDPDKDSYVKLELWRLPENLLSDRTGQAPYSRQVDQGSFAAITKLLVHKALCNRLPVVSDLERGD